MNFVNKVKQAVVPDGHVAVFWLGQAGFLIKTASGKLTAIDPYFSDYVERTVPEEGYGFKRLMPALCDADELIFDNLLISHEHGDHLDGDAIADMMKNGRTVVYTNAPSAKIMLEMGLDSSRINTLEKNQPVNLSQFTLIPVDADHGDLAPEALGFILEFPFIKLYYSGDTALSSERLSVPLEMKPDVSILPINGAFGNLDSLQAAKYAAMLNTKVCIPCHFWTFPLHLGNPLDMINHMKELAPSCKLAMLCQGESILLPESQSFKKQP
jgi:L-ascorbate 6-phosphate lactonase